MSHPALLALRRTPTPVTMTRLALAGIVAQCGIVVSGGAVRLTNSGLGCPTWPRCTGDHLTPVADPAHPGIHQAIEFTNRLLTFAVLAVGIACVVGARRLGRRDLVRLAWLQPLGVLAQIVMGGITVLVDLHPAAVATHFLLSMAILTACVALHHRCAPPPAVELRRELVRLTRAIAPVVALLLVVGTVVTGSGPHAGDRTSPRFPLRIQTVAQLHADLVWITLGLTFALVLALRLTTGPEVVRQRARELLTIELAQGFVGYLQYFTGDPAAVVGIHIAGACLTWVFALRLVLSTSSPRPAAPPLPESASGTAMAPSAPAR